MVATPPRDNGLQGDTRQIPRSKSKSTVHVSPSDLDSLVHPIFTRENWPQNDFIYEKWLPTFRLALLFLTEKVVLGWWVQAALGPYCTSSGSRPFCGLTYAAAAGWSCAMHRRSS
jgi:hypothetical protein